MSRVRDRYRFARWLAWLALAATVAVLAARTLPASAQDEPAPVISERIGAMVVAAQQLLAEEPADMEAAVAELDAAMASMPSSYETGVILYMRGGAKYRLGDQGGALIDWRRALRDGDLGDNERAMLAYNIEQLELSAN